MQSIGSDQDAYESLLTFLEWDEPEEDRFAQDVRIVLASAEFSKEITTSVLWLNERGLNIRCVRMRPYQYGDDTLLDVQQLIPLPEAAEYQVSLGEKARRSRASRTSMPDVARFDVSVGQETFKELRREQAVFQVVRYLCEKGVDPEEIRQALAWRKSLFADFEGRLESEAFEQQLIERWQKEGKDPARMRYFLADNELIYANGRTYAVSAKWGARAKKGLMQLVEAFGDHGIECSESTL